LPPLDIQRHQFLLQLVQFLHVLHIVPVRFIVGGISVGISQELDFFLSFFLSFTNGPGSFGVLRVVGGCVLFGGVVGCSGGGFGGVGHGFQDGGAFEGGEFGESIIL